MSDGRLQESESRLHINFGPGPVVIIKRKWLGVRWCFACRKHIPFEMVIRRYNVEPLLDWYGPWAAVECTRCHDNDTDLFPGRVRVWEDV